MERIDAAQWLLNSLMALEVHVGNICYIDGHMIPFWSSVSMLDNNEFYIKSSKPGNHLYSNRNTLFFIGFHNQSGIK